VYQVFSNLNVDLQKFILVAVLFHLQKFTIWTRPCALLFPVKIISTNFSHITECYKKLKPWILDATCYCEIIIFVGTMNFHICWHYESSYLLALWVIIFVGTMSCNALKTELNSWRDKYTITCIWGKMSYILVNGDLLQPVNFVWGTNVNYI